MGLLKNCIIIYVYVSVYAMYVKVSKEAKREYRIPLEIEL